MLLLTKWRKSGPVITDAIMYMTESARYTKPIYIGDRLNY